VRLAKRLWALVNRRAADRAMDREMASHLVLLAEDFERRGLDPEQAKQAARRAFGNAGLAREEHRDARSIVWLEQTWQDLRHAARSLTRNPGFALLSILTLALGIGVNTTLFSAYNALALKPLPIANPREVVRIKRWFQSGAQGDIQFGFSFPEYVYCRDRSSQFASVVAAGWPVGVRSATSKLTGQLVSPNYFSALGIEMRIGRGFLESEDDAIPVVVLSHAFWQKKYQGDAAVLGKTLLLDKTQFVVVGVTPAEFTGASAVPVAPDFWAPLSHEKALVPSAGASLFQLLARLKPAAMLTTAQPETDGLIRQIDRASNPVDRTTSVTLQHTNFLAQSDDPRFQAIVAGLGLVVGLVLMVACANIANMLLARGAARHREIAARLLLGASRSRVVRHLLTESLLLSLTGGAVGLVLSMWASRLLWIRISESLAGVAGITMLPPDQSLDVRVIAYALGLSAVAGIFFGLSPALQSTRMDLASAAKEESPMFGRRSRFRSVLIGAQVTASMILLICASFLTRALARSESAQPGFDTKHLVFVWGDFGAEDARGTYARKRQVAERIRAVTQVQAVSLGAIPMLGTWTPPMIASEIRGRTLASYATAGYFETLGIAIVRGRAFNEVESSRAPTGKDADRHAVISESAARLYWPDADPVGKRFSLDVDFRGTLVDFEVIGVARDVRYANLSRVDPAHVYLSGFASGSDGIAVRVAGDSLSAAASVRNALQDEMGLRIIAFEQGPLLMQKSMARVFGQFALLLAGLTVLLASIGIYGVTSYLVSQRVKEIGVRVALGAPPSGVLRAVVWGSLQPVSAGLCIGTVCAAAVAYAVHATLQFPGSTDFFYGLAFYDPVTFAGAAGLFAFIAAIASAGPALRALRVDPMTALRYE
jgi:macrolide transport system ATP-binding/permease protein